VAMPDGDGGVPDPPAVAAGYTGGQPLVAERTELIWESPRTRVLRVWPVAPLPERAPRARSEPAAVICKQALGPGAVARARAETEILARLAGVPGVPRLATVVQPAAVVVTDDGGESLADALRAGRIDPAAAPELALRLASTVAEMHGRGVVHRDINPANILFNGPRQPPVLIDFDLATTVAEDRPGFTHHRDIIGTLAYVPPEQTGRTGLPLDHRADLYALGAVLYELISGQPPFGAGAGDELRLVRDILVRVPRPLADLGSPVPPMLSEIVARLLEKEPGRRYQSADGLARDLALVVRRHAIRFALGRWDFPPRLTAPSRLVGRDSEVAALRAAFDAALGTGPRGVLIGGEPGVGKSTLTDRLRSVVAGSSGWFVTGKSDQQRPEAAAGAAVQALGALGRLLLAEPEVALADQRARLLTALGPNRSLIAAVLPEFGSLLSTGPAAAGDRPAPADGDPAEAAARLRQAGLDLLRTVVSPDRPLVMVIDDVQWADPVTLGLLDAVLTAPDLSGLLLVSTYRPAEVDAAHPLAGLIERWHRLGAIRPLELRNLPPGDLATLLTEVLRLGAGPAADLAEILRQSTGGNPYDTLELVNALRRNGVLTLGRAGWQWDPAAIRQQAAQADVGELLTERIGRLPPETADLLRLLACLGVEVGVEVLALAAEAPVEAAVRCLEPALADGLLVMDRTGGRRDRPAGTVLFAHDRVQEAAYAALSPAAASAMHRRLGRRLAASADTTTRAAEQHLRSTEPIASVTERQQVAKLYRAAADSAALISNHAAAERFLSAAAAIWATLDPGTGGADPLEVDIARHAALYGMGRLAEADAVFAAIETRCPQPLDLARAARLQLAVLSQSNRHHEAVELGRRVVAELGHPLPAGEAGRLLPERLDELVRWAARLDLAADLGRAEVTDTRLIAVGRLYDRLLPSAFFTGDRALLAWVVLASQRMWAEHGPSAALAANLSCTGLVTVGVRQDYKVGYAVGRHVLAVSESHGWEPETSVLRHRHALHVLPWAEPLPQAADQARLAREGLVRGGDLQMANHTCLTVLAAELSSGRSLEIFAAEVDAALALAERTGHAHTTQVVHAYRQLGRSLVGATSTLGGFADESFPIEPYEAGLDHNPMAAGIYQTCRALAAAVFGDLPALDRHSELAMSLRALVPGYTVAVIQVLRALALAGRAREAGAAATAECLGELDGYLAWLTARAVDAPVNFSHLRWLVEAERAWLTGDFRAAMTAFDRAGVALGDRDAGWQAALIAERAAAFYRAHDLAGAAAHALAEAYQKYAAWGAAAKVAELAYQHPELAGRPAAAALEGGGSSPAGVPPIQPIGAESGGAPAAGPRPTGAPPAAAQPTGSRHVGSLHAGSPRGGTLHAGTLHVGSSALHGDSIDLLAVLRASEALAAETRLDRLQAAIVDQLTTLTGATEVLVVLCNADTGGWFLLAPDTGEAVPVEAAGSQGLLPVTAVRYVRRTGQPLLVADATRDDRFAQDRYVAAADRCSLLVLPLAVQGAARGLLVLVNRLSGGAFTQDRLDAVRLISGPLMVSLGNAQLYGSLEERVADRTKALEAANQKLAELSATDSLTGLANRRRFTEVLRREWDRAVRTGTPLGVLMIDVDRFKRYNDEYGHLAGDECLRQVAAALAGAARAATDLVARYGGEEFAGVLPGADTAGALVVAERIRAAVEGLGLPHTGSEAGFVTVSLGAASTMPGPELSPDDLLGRADAALYQAKSAGRNRAMAGAPETVQG
jgi:diguanylate cyclase (GGDEF)-like protein